MDYFKQPDYQKIALPLAAHEAGHFVIASHFKFTVGPISIKIITPTDHIANAEVLLSEAYTTLEDVLSYCEKRVIILYAGAAAEAMAREELTSEKIRIILEHLGGRSDFDKLGELIRIVRGIKYPKTKEDRKANKELGNIATDLLTRSVKLVKEYKDIIMEIANKIASNLSEIKTQHKITVKEISDLPLFKKKFIEKISTPDQGTTQTPPSL